LIVHFRDLKIMPTSSNLLGISANRSPSAAGSLVSATESDRRQLAAQVEKQIVAPLKLLLAQAAAYEQTLPAHPSSHMAISVLASLARQVLQQAYDLQASLHPVVLETLGLEPALEALAAQFERLHSLRLVLSLGRLPRRLPPALELALFRLVQEVLDGLADQHALQVQVSLVADEQALRLDLTWITGAADLAGPFFSEPLRQAALQHVQPFGGELALGQLSDGQVHLAVHLPLSLGVSFTRRESQVLEALVQGCNNKEIARKLSISPRTVNYHLDHIYAKLGVRTRTEAAVLALAQGWASPATRDIDPG
jgi:DNA-binding CsgD family transcriptional regulator/glucose-6-phosphate-specific signal transduction histidine kinase